MAQYRGAQRFCLRMENVLFVEFELTFSPLLKEVFGNISDEVKAKFAFCLKLDENNV